MTKSDRPCGDGPRFGRGPSSLPAELGSADRALSRACAVIDWVGAVTPINAASERERLADVLVRGGFPSPRYEYRPTRIEPALRRCLASALRCVEADRGELAMLYADKLRETMLLAELVEAVGTARFAGLSGQVFGAPSDEVVREAARWTGRGVAREPRAIPAQGAGSLGAALKGEMASYGLEWQIERNQRYAATVLIRPGVVVLGGSGFCSTEERSRLCVHEIGVHVVTLSAALGHRIALLALGTAGYVADHEGAALCAEEVRGVLTPFRRSLIGARALASAAAYIGEPAAELARRLVDEHGLDGYDAAIAIERGYRGGGLTKDLTYIPGYTRVRSALSSGTLDVTAFLCGRMRLSHTRVVRELLRRGVLTPARAISRELTDTRALRELGA